MRKVAFLLIASFYFLFVSAFSAAASRGVKITQIDDLSHRSGILGEFKALIIGINVYKDNKIPNLKTAVKDANTIAKVLKDKYGFNTELLLDRKATREAKYNSLRRLAASTKPDDSVLIYFAGHGDLDRLYNEGWWIPADAAGGKPVTYLNNFRVQRAMRNMEARHVLLISDSCNSGTLFGEGRRLPPVIDNKYYLTLYNEKSRWGMTPGNKEPVSDTGSEGHSVFAYQLLKELKQNDKPFINIQEVYTRIAPIISNNSEQTPICRPIRNTGDQGGEFVFVAAVKEESSSTGSKSPKGLWEMELAFWQSIQDSDDPTLYKAYIEKFPNGTFVPIAKNKIAMIKKGKQFANMASEDTQTKATQKVITNSIGMRFNLIPEGTFMMGSKLNHKVTINRAFYLQSTEVTQGQWEKVMGHNPSYFKECGNECPVECVSWVDAHKFIKKLNEIEGIDTYRLPTEAEWEYAVRAGTTTLFTFGDDEDKLPDYAWFDSNSDSKTHRVGQKKPNAWGLYDMHGNVWEWVEDDWHWDYNGAPDDGRAWIDKPRGACRVLRGGGWGSGAHNCRSAGRYHRWPDFRPDVVGFRLSRSVALSP